ncbi:MAG: helix-turn-helix domain-containing protein, partial [Pseudomonadota bacterium]
ADHFIRNFNLEFGKNISGLTDDALDYLNSNRFPGNVRELSNVVERAVALESGERISLDTLKEGLNMGRGEDPEKRGLEDMSMQLERYGIEGCLGMIEEKILRRYMKQHDGDRTKIAAKLGITVRSLRYRLSKYGLVSDSPASEFNDEA